MRRGHLQPSAEFVFSGPAPAKAGPSEVRPGTNITGQATALNSCRPSCPAHEIWNRIQSTMVRFTSLISCTCLSRPTRVSRSRRTSRRSFCGTAVAQHQPRGSSRNDNEERPGMGRHRGRYGWGKDQAEEGLDRTAPSSQVRPPPRGSECQEMRGGMPCWSRTS